MLEEIGGYLEFERYCKPCCHEGAVALNCGRSCLAYLICARGIKKIALPYYLCESVGNLCRREGVAVRYYHISESFLPLIDGIDEDEYLFLVNYYGLLSDEQILAIKVQYDRVIADYTQAYFREPLLGVDTIYSCRKFFGVPDGGFLYTDAVLTDEIPLDESYNRMHYILGRFEHSANEFYAEYVAANKFFANEPVKRMSRLTDNLLRGIDYQAVESARTSNFVFLHKELGSINQLNLPCVTGPFAYPLFMNNGAAIRKNLQAHKIYVPTLWPNVLVDNPEDSVEYHFASDILPLPCDQRYTEAEMQIILDFLLN